MFQGVAPANPFQSNIPGVTLGVRPRRRSLLDPNDPNAPQPNLNDDKQSYLPYIHDAMKRLIANQQKLSILQIPKLQAPDPGLPNLARQAVLGEPNKYAPLVAQGQSQQAMLGQEQKNLDDPNLQPQHAQYDPISVPGLSTDVPQLNLPDKPEAAPLRQPDPITGILGMLAGAAVPQQAGNIASRILGSSMQDQSRQNAANQQGYDQDMQQAVMKNNRDMSLWNTAMGIMQQNKKQKLDVDSTNRDMDNARKANQAEVWRRGAGLPPIAKSYEAMLQAEDRNRAAQADLAEGQAADQQRLGNNQITLGQWNNDRQLRNDQSGIDEKILGAATQAQAHQDTVNATKSRDAGRAAIAEGRLGILQQQADTAGARATSWEDHAKQMEQIARMKAVTAGGVGAGPEGSTYNKLQLDAKAKQKAIDDDQREIAKFYPKGQSKGKPVGLSPQAEDEINRRRATIAANVAQLNEINAQIPIAAAKARQERMSLFGAQSGAGGQLGQPTQAPQQPVISGSGKFQWNGTQWVPRGK